MFTGFIPLSALIILTQKDPLFSSVSFRGRPAIFCTSMARHVQYLITSWRKERTHAPENDDWSQVKISIDANLSFGYEGKRMPSRWSIQSISEKNWKRAASGCSVESIQKGHELEGSGIANIYMKASNPEVLIMCAAIPECHQLWMPPGSPFINAAESEFHDTSPLIILYETILETQHKTGNTKNTNSLTRKRKMAMMKSDASGDKSIQESKRADANDRLEDIYIVVQHGKYSPDSIFEDTLQSLRILSQRVTNQQLNGTIPRCLRPMTEATACQLVSICHNYNQ